MRKHCKLIFDLHINNFQATMHKFRLKVKISQAHRRYLPKNILQVKCTCKTCTIHGSNQKMYSYECFFLSHNSVIAH